MKKIIIIGAGVTGAGACYALKESGFDMSNVTIIDCGRSGVGVESSDDVEFEERFVRRSGSGCMDDGAERVKMMVNIYPCSSQQFVQHHGRSGARRYLAACEIGIERQKSLAKQFDVNCLSNGSLCNVGVCCCEFSKIKIKFVL
jgi:monoamine oxidase